MTANASSRTIRIGAVVRSTASVLRERHTDLLLLGLAFVWAPVLLVDSLDAPSWTLQFAVGLMSLVFVGGASLMTYRQLSGGEPLGIAAAISAGALFWGDVWFVCALTTGVAALGFVLFIAPGVIWLTACIPAVAVVVVERRKAPEALQRAWDLSQGSRWRIPGLMALAALLIGILYGAVVLSDWLAANWLDDDVVDALWRYGLWPIANLAAFAMTTVGSAAVYAALRAAQESALGDPGAVFD